MNIIIIKNSKELVHNLEKLKINRNDKLIFLGVTNMFGKIPKEELIKILENNIA